MKRLFTSKRAVNDVSILAGILALFLISATIIPFINEEFQTGYSEFNVDGTVDEVKQEGKNVSTLSAFEILLTVFKLAFWDFGNTLNLIWFVDIFYTLMALIFIIVIARNVWIGGGA